MDAIRKPNVETLVKIGNFELTVVAYRAITRAEDPKANLSVKMLKRIAESMGKRLEVQFV